QRPALPGRLGVAGSGLAAALAAGLSHGGTDQRGVCAPADRSGPTGSAVLVFGVASGGGDGERGAGPHVWTEVPAGALLVGGADPAVGQDCRLQPGGVPELSL